MFFDVYRGLVQVESSYSSTEGALDTYIATLVLPVIIIHFPTSTATETLSKNANWWNTYHKGRDRAACWVRYLKSLSEQPLTLNLTPKPSSRNPKLTWVGWRKPDGSCLGLGGVGSSRLQEVHGSNALGV